MDYTQNGKNDGAVVIPEAAEDFSQTTVGEPVAQPQLNAVIIQIIRNEDGSVNTPISISGDVTALEIESILRIAKDNFIKTI